MLPRMHIETDKGEHVEHRDLHQYEGYLCHCFSGLFILHDSGVVNDKGETVAYPRVFNLETSEMMEVQTIYVLTSTRPPVMVVDDFLVPVVESRMKITRLPSEPDMDYETPWLVQQIMCGTVFEFRYEFKTHTEALTLTNKIVKQLRKHGDKS